MKQTEQTAQVNALEIALDNLRGLLDKSQSSARYVYGGRNQKRALLFYNEAYWHGVSMAIDVVETLINDIEGDKDGTDGTAGTDQCAGNSAG